MSGFLPADPPPAWRLPASPDDETRTSRVIAAGLRAEAAQCLAGIAERNNQRAALAVEIEVLEQSRWSCIRQAARIEREIRGVG